MSSSRRSSNSSEYDDSEFPDIHPDQSWMCRQEVLPPVMPSVRHAFLAADRSLSLQHDYQRCALEKTVSKRWTIFDAEFRRVSRASDVFGVIIRSDISCWFPVARVGGFCQPQHGTRVKLQFYEVRTGIKNPKPWYGAVVSTPPAETAEAEIVSYLDVTFFVSYLVVTGPPPPMGLNKKFLVKLTFIDYPYAIHRERRAIQDMWRYQYRSDGPDLLRYFFNTQAFAIDSAKFSADITERQRDQFTAVLNSVGKLNADQIDFCNTVLSNKKAITLLQGPVGTGKTFTSVALAVALAKIGFKVMYCCASDKGVAKAIKRGQNMMIEQSQDNNEKSLGDSVENSNLPPSTVDKNIFDRWDVTPTYYIAASKSTVDPDVINPNVDEEEQAAIANIDNALLGFYLDVPPLSLLEKKAGHKYGYHSQLVDFIQLKALDASDSKNAIITEDETEEIQQFARGKDTPVCMEDGPSINDPQGSDFFQDIFVLHKYVSHHLLSKTQILFATSTQSAHPEIVGRFKPDILIFDDVNLAGSYAPLVPISVNQTTLKSIVMVGGAVVAEPFGITKTQNNFSQLLLLSAFDTNVMTPESELPVKRLWEFYLDVDG
ncbi:hypothetical protein BT63DRAFT_417893 [Microthyrium microscopicum]|uniref:DNA2/NAM7 helicase helicase domain-containing protein n=1 Tax=Microthyrium microscopicum TaxID=703497 RepID=A0A6A6U0S7_9PEZI|nr:hypothetical protein BT63DRAFT_417893 [Microthyrium microscopicum]